MKKTILFLSLCFIALGSLAQSKKVALHHAGNTTLFIGNSGFANAVSAAVSGDTIYLPGGYWTASNIDKKLVIYGAGHYPDSTQATEASHLTGGLEFQAGSDSSLFQGIDVAGDVNIRSTSYVTINRCKFNNSSIIVSSDYITYSENTILYSINVNNLGDYITIRNNFFYGTNGYNHSIVKLFCLLNH